MSTSPSAFFAVATRTANAQQFAGRGYDCGRVTAPNLDGTYRVSVMGRTDPTGAQADCDFVEAEGGKTYQTGDYVLLARVQGSAGKQQIIGISGWRCSGVTRTVVHNVG